VVRTIVAVVALAGCGRVGFDVGSGDAVGGCGHTFCDNFDRTTAVDTGWDSANLVGGSMLAIDTSVVSSGSGSLAVTLVPGAGNIAALSKTFSLIAQVYVNYAFDLQLDMVDTTGEVDLADLTWEPSPPGCGELGFFITRAAALDQVALQETYGMCGPLTDTPVVIGSGFHHIEVDTQIGAATVAHVRVTVDGTIVAVDKAVPVDVPPSAVKLAFGAPYESGVGTPWLLHLDNLTVDIQ
jgi:hypothetical protein